MYIDSLLKNFIIFVCSFNTFQMFNSNHTYTIRHRFLCLIFSCLLCIETIITKSLFIEFSYVIPAFSFFLVTALLYQLSTERTIYYSFISYAMNLVLFHIVTTMFLLILIQFCKTETKYLIAHSTSAVSFIYMVAAFVISKSRFIKSYKPILRSKSSMTLGLICSLLTLVILTYDNSKPANIPNGHLACVLLLFLLPYLLLIWWRSQITKSYREKLRLLEVESLRTSQQEQANYISQLEKENERMGRIIHKDNRIVNAMADSISEYLRDDALSDAERHNKGVALAKQIESIRTDRQSILLSEEHIHPNPLSQTGYVGVDALIAYMAKEAAQHHITLHFDFHTEFFENGSLCMSEEDLVHLLSDTLKNAVIATSHNNGKAIKLSMLKLKGIPTIAISDSGIPFTIDTYMNFGLEKSSTHIDEGGSGIGLLDIWSLKEKYKATLYIDEQPTTDTFTKQLVFILDKKNRYMISSNRYKEIQHQQSRADLYVVNPAVERSL